MLRLLAATALALLANAVAFIVAAVLLDGFTIGTTTFVVAVIIFTVLEVVLGPFILKLSLRYLPALTGGIALVTTLVGLIITDLVSDGLSITGLGTWLVAVLIVWLGGLLAGLVLPLFLFKNVLSPEGTPRKAAA